MSQPKQHGKKPKPLREESCRRANSAERENEQNRRGGALAAVCEQTAYDLRLRDLTVQRAVDDAQRRLEISQQHLTTLLGYEEDQKMLHEGGSAISQVEFRAPFVGIIESRTYAANERVKQGDLFSCWPTPSNFGFKADLRESNWPALQLTPNSEIEVELPRISSATFHGSLVLSGT